MSSVPEVATAGSNRTDAIKVEHVAPKHRGAGLIVTLARPLVAYHGKELRRSPSKVFGSQARLHREAGDACSQEAAQDLLVHGPDRKSRDS